MSNKKQVSQMANNSNKPNKNIALWLKTLIMLYSCQ